MLVLRTALVFLASTAVLLVSVWSTAQSPPSAPSSNPPLPRPGDLALAHEAGSILIGLSVRPALPGPNALLLYVAPLTGPAAAADVPLTLDVDGSSVPLATCSSDCRSATVTLNGGEHLEVRADAAGGGSASFDLPALPAPDGTHVFQQLQDRMHQLRSYRIDERLGPVEPPLMASYTFQAPDRMQMELGNGSEAIWVGPTRYTRSAASTAWQRETIDGGPAVPSFEWDPHAGGNVAIGAHIVGRVELDGVETQVVAFFDGTPQTPVWFQLWVDASGLVHHAEMRAQGHFMTHRYFDFDAPLTVEPPAASVRLSDSGGAHRGSARGKTVLYASRAAEYAASASVI